MITQWKLIAGVALGLGTVVGTAGAMDITGFGTTHSGGKAVAAENYRSTSRQAQPFSNETTGSISNGAPQRMQPTDCPAPPKPGSLQTQGGNSGASERMACPDYR